MLSWGVFFLTAGLVWAGLAALPRKSREQVVADTRELERLRRESRREYQQLKSVRAVERLLCDHPKMGWPFAVTLIGVGTLLICLSLVVAEGGDGRSSTPQPDAAAAW